MVCWLFFINNNNVTESKDVYLTGLCLQWSRFVLTVVPVCVFNDPGLCFQWSPVLCYFNLTA